MESRRRREEQRAAAHVVVRSMVRASWANEEHRSRHGLGAPVRVAFIDGGPGRHPMASLMHARNSRGGGGGRGGRTRLALYLSALWVAGGGDHSTTRPAPFWARLLGLRDPDEAGARVVRASWAELVQRGFCTAEPGKSSGDVPTYTLLSDRGDRDAYTIPKGRGGDLYFRIPETMWTRGLIGDEELTGPGLAMYLVALRTASMVGRTDSLVFPGASFNRDVGLSDATRKKGLRNLDALGVLSGIPEARDDFGDQGHRLRPRNVYTINAEWAPRVSRGDDHRRA